MGERQSRIGAFGHDHRMEPGSVHEAADEDGRTGFVDEDPQSMFGENRCHEGTVPSAPQGEWRINDQGP